jgi:hypothetical protein
MPGQWETEMCIFCKQGHVTMQKGVVAFHQSTDKGDVFCQVTIQMTVCAQCGVKYWDNRAEAMLDEAVRQAYKKLE